MLLRLTRLEIIMTQIANIATPSANYHISKFLERVGNTLYFKKEQNALWNGTVELIHADAYLNPAVKSDSMNRASKEFIVEVSMQRM